MATIVADGRDLLMYRPGTHAPAFVVSEGGAVRDVKLNVRGDRLSLYSIKPAGGTWFAQYVSPAATKAEGVNVITYAIDPQTGKPLAAYRYPRGLGFGVACINGPDFTFVKETEGKVSLVKMSPAQTGGGEASPPQRK